jgi:delta 1-pyrroline-5-carboxylate dehydrogenase
MRASLLRRFAEAVDADTETLAALEVRNAGHTSDMGLLDSERATAAYLADAGARPAG